jgi:two-component system response regulator DegU
MTCRILLAEHHAMLRQRIKEILAAEPGFEVVAETGLASEVVRFALRHRPDVTIIASDLGGAGGTDLTRRVLALLPNTAVIIMSMNDDERYITQARKAGAGGYVLKNEAADKLIEAVRGVQPGRLSSRPVA